MTAPYHDDGRVRLYLGDALEVARTLPDESADCIITSPPYYGLRDYEVAGQYGAERSVAEYVDHLVALFAELRRVLAADGTLWLNLGDTYQSSGGSIGVGRNAKVYNTKVIGSANRTRIATQLPDKSLLGVPWRVAFALQDDGWILRSDIIWAKPNPMPEAVTDRPTKSHEHVFLFSRSQRYHYDADAIAEVGVVPAGTPRNVAKARKGEVSGRNDNDRFGVVLDGMRNARDVWTIPTQAFPEAHFAVFPRELPRRCIRAGAKPGGVVLDPFSGSGTTGEVALLEGRSYVGIELNRAYLDLSLRSRFAQQPLDFGQPTPAEQYDRGLITEREYLLATGVRATDIPGGVT